MKHLLIMLILAFCFINSEATACDKEMLSGNNAVSAANSVFIGKVVNLQYLDPPEQTKLEPRIIVTFSVNEVFKGEVKEQVIIHTTHNKGSCNGYVFEAGKEYLVYTKENNKIKGFLANFIGKQKTRIGIKVYGGTKPIDEAAQEIANLRGLR